MAKVFYQCAQCGDVAWREAGQVNRSQRLGMPLYCNRSCAGLARRLASPPTAEERKAAKAIYDRRRRAEKADEIRAAKAEYYQRNRDPERERAYRQANMARHVEYCRRPEYRAKKREYDIQHRARKDFGPFAEAALILRDLDAEIMSRVEDRFELYALKGTLNKKLNRRREYDRQRA